MNKKRIIYSLIIGLLVLLVIAIIFPIIYPVLYVYLAVMLTYFGIIVKDIENFGKISIGIIIGSFILYFVTFNIEFIDNIRVLINCILDAGMLLFFIYLLIILPKYSSRFHMGMEDSGVGKYHLHEGFFGIVLYIIMSFLMFIPSILAYSINISISAIDQVCLVIGGGGNILSTFFIGRDWDDIKNGLLIEKIEDGKQPEEHESFWTPKRHLLKKYTKLNDFTTGFILCSAGIALYYSKLFDFYELKIWITIISLGLLTFGGFLMGRSWIEMLEDRFGEVINRPVLLSLKSSLPPDVKITSVDLISYPIWIITGFIEKKKRKWLFFKRKIKEKKTLLVDDITGKLLYLQEGKINRCDEFNESELNEIKYMEGYRDIERNLDEDTIVKNINFLDDITIKPGILPIYAVKLKNENDNSERFLGVHLNTGSKIELFQDYSVNYLMPFKEEGKVVKDVIVRISSFLKRVIARKN
ncbi:MAG: hypothetical protein ACTSRP_06520 [Candidatus Helarchaeota archaeon]